MSEPIRLHGSPLSNYYNKIKIALLEMEIPFSEHARRPHTGTWPAEGSPSGKIPYIETADGSIYESQVILEYLEDTRPGASRYPGTPAARAHCRELIAYLELHVEAAARPLYQAAYWGGEVLPTTRARAIEALRAGLVALERRALFAPYLCGTEYSHADGVAWVHLNTVARTLKILEEAAVVHEHLPAIVPWMVRLGERPSIRQVEQDRRDATRQLRT